MKNIYVKMFIFCLIPLPLLFALDYLVDHGLRKSRYTYYSEWNDIFDSKINADLLVLGTSRAWILFSPKAMDSAFHVNSYNLAMDGADFDFGYKRLKIYLAHNKKPKTIIVEVGFVKTLVGSDVLPGVQQFLPYMRDSSMWNFANSKNLSFSFFDRHFPLYKYNNELSLIKEGVMSYYGKGSRGTKYKGYEPKVLEWDNAFSEFQRQNPNGWKPETSKAAIDEFYDFFGFCQSNNIKVIMVYTPVYIEATKMLVPEAKEKLMSVFYDVSKKFNAPFYNYEQDSLCYNRDLFYNSQHLNKKGADLFNPKFVNDVKKEFQ